MTFKNKIRYVILVFIILLNGCGPIENSLEEEQSSEEIYEEPPAQANECESLSLGDPCGRSCPISRCENSKYTNGEPFGDYVQIPSTEGTCQVSSNGILACDSKINRCTDNSQWAFINGGCTDMDSDTIIDSLEAEECKGTNYGCDICLDNDIGSTDCPTNEKLGCPKKSDDPFCAGICKHIVGGGGQFGPMSLNIIILPCNFEDGTLSGPAEGFFDRLTEVTGNHFVNTVEPFKSYSDNFIVTAIYPEEFSTTSIDPSTKIMPSCSSNMKDIVDKCLNYDLNGKDNTVYLEIRNWEGSGGCNIQSFKGVYRGECYVHFGEVLLQESENDGIKAWLTHAIFHEIGHALELGHSYYPEGDADEGLIKHDNLPVAIRSDWTGEKPNTQNKGIPNDFYIPGLPETYFSDYNNNPITKFSAVPCPIWNPDVIGSDEISKWVIEGEESINCIPFYDGYANLYRPWSDLDIMSYGTQEKFNPIAKKLIKDALVMGYQKYLEYPYPLTCADINQEFIDTFDNKPKDSIELIKDKCLLNECGFIPVDGSNNKQVCCDKIMDAVIKQDCYTFTSPTAPKPSLPDVTEFPDSDSGLPDLPSIDTNNPANLILPSEPIDFEFDCPVENEYYPCQNMFDKIDSSQNIVSSYSPPYNFPNPNLHFSFFNPRLESISGLMMHVYMAKQHYTTSADIDVIDTNGNKCHFNYVTVEEYTNGDHFMLINLKEECDLILNGEILSIDFKPMGSNYGNWFGDISFYYN